MKYPWRLKEAILRLKKAFFFFPPRCDQFSFKPQFSTELNWTFIGLPGQQVLDAGLGPFCPVPFVVGHHRCIVPCGVAVAMARMGYIVLRLCMMNTLPTNPPVGGYMPVNYCTFGEEKKRRRWKEEKLRWGAHEEEEEEEQEKEERETGRKIEAPMAVIMKLSVTD